jgi:hypothetical protein
MKGLRFSLIALLLAFGLLMPMGAGDLVLCIGADGHIGFEPARNSRCTTPVTPTLTPSQQITASTSQPDHCGPCVDTPLLTSDAHSPQFVPLFPLLLQLAVPGFAHDAQCPAYDHSPSLNPPLTAWCSPGVWLTLAERLP